MNEIKKPENNDVPICDKYMLTKDKKELRQGLGLAVFVVFQIDFMSG